MHERNVSYCLSFLGTSDCENAAGEAACADTHGIRFFFFLSCVCYGAGNVVYTRINDDDYRNLRAREGETEARL